MKLWEYLVIMIGFLHHLVKGKAFRASKDNLKGTFDHMNENLYLKEIPNGYEMRYVPTVNGKPIFIPFEENTQNILKARPTKMSILNFEANMKQKESTGKPFQTHLKNDLNQADHPLVIDVVTKANNVNFKPNVKESTSNGLFQTTEYVKKEGKQTLVIDDHLKQDYDESDYDNPVIVEALVKKNPVKKELMYDSPVVVEALVNKYHTVLNKKDVSTESHPEAFPQSEEDFFSAQQFDAGSGIINERSSDFWSRNKFKKCVTPNEEPGNCMPIQLCHTPNFQLTLDDLMKRMCTIGEIFIGICCPEFPAEILKVDWKNISSHQSFDTKSEGCGKIQEESDSWPFMAPLMSISTRKIFCCGVLIRPQYVLTAAHCTKKIPDNQIVIALGQKEIEVLEIKRHSQYNSRTMQYDIALLKLSRKVSKPTVCLPRDESYEGMEALMVGCHFSASKIEEKLLVLPPKECPKLNILCTEPRTEDVTCNVDTGAPLILKHNGRYEVIGLLTWNRNDCPALFTRVSHFKGWIENHSSF